MKHDFAFGALQQGAGDMKPVVLQQGVLGMTPSSGGTITIVAASGGATQAIQTTVGGGQKLVTLAPMQPKPTRKQM